MEPRAPLPVSADAEAITPDSRARLPGEVPTIVALSEDPALLQALTLAATGQATVVTAPSADRFSAQMVSNSAEIAVIDAASAPNPIKGFLSGLHRQLARLRLIIIGSAALQEELHGQLADGTVFRYALEPASAPRLKVMLSTALDIGRAPALPGEPLLRPGNAAPRWFWPLLLTLTVLGAMVVGWYASSFASQRHLLP